MKKLIAFLLASVMVACCFAVSASAADQNLVAGKAYTLTSSDETISYYSPNLGDDTNPPTDGGQTMEIWKGQVTDGKIRTGTEESKIKDALAGTTLELQGTNRIYYYTFDLGAEKGISSVVVLVAKIGGNRSTNIVGVEVSSDGATWAPVDFSNTYDVVANSEQANAAFSTGGSDPRDQFFNITASFAAVNAQYVKVALDTSNPGEGYGHNFYVDNAGNTERGYILQFDEIQVWGGEPVSEQPPVNDPSESEPVDDPSESDPVDDPSESDPVDDPSEDVSVDDPSEDVSVDDPSEDVSVDDPSEDVSVDDPSEDVSVDDPSENAPVESEDDNTSVEQPGNNSTPSTGDAGLAVFAVLAVVSLAGVVVAKKVK